MQLSGTEASGSLPANATKADVDKVETGTVATRATGRATTAPRATVGLHPGSRTDAIRHALFRPASTTGFSPAGRASCVTPRRGLEPPRHLDDPHGHFLLQFTPGSHGGFRAAGVGAFPKPMQSPGVDEPT